MRFTLLLGSIALVGVAIADLTGNPSYLRSFLPSTFSALTTQKTTPIVQSALLEAIQNASNLTTQIYTAQVVIPVEQEKKAIGVTYEKSKLLYMGVVRTSAGVDLSKVVVEGGVLKLPCPSVTENNLDNDRSQVYDFGRDITLWIPDPNTPEELRKMAADKAIAEGGRTAIEGGILKSAGDRAESVVQSLIRAAGSDIKVETSTNCGVQSDASN